MKIYSIGFESRSKNELIQLLTFHKIKTLVDARCFPEADSAGYAKETELSKLFALNSNIQYTHCKELAPTPDLLTDYFKKGLPWPQYEIRYRELLVNRQVEIKINVAQFGSVPCFFCLENSPEKCHRRLALDYLGEYWKGLEVEHIL